MRARLSLRTHPYSFHLPSHHNSCPIVSDRKYNIWGTRVYTIFTSCLTCMSFDMGYWERIMCWLGMVLFPFLSVMPNIYSRLGYKSLERILPVALASLIEGHQHTKIYYHSWFDLIRLVFMCYCTAPQRIVTFPFSGIFLLDKGLRTAPYKYLVSLLRTNTLSHIPYVCGLQFLFSSWLFLSIIIFAYVA